MPWDKIIIYYLVIYLLTYLLNTNLLIQLYRFGINTFPSGTLDAVVAISSYNIKSVLTYLRGTHTIGAIPVLIKVLGSKL